MRRFGRLRRLASGRWQARYHGPDGIDRAAPHTFARKVDAERWLNAVEADLISGEWTDPDAAQVGLTEFGRRWIEERAGLRPKTVQLYRGLLARQIAPGLGGLALDAISPARVRAWRAALLNDGVSAVTAAKAYRLLKTMLQTAVDDRLLRMNPCQIRGASVERSPERPTLTIEEVLTVADGMPPRLRLMVLLGTFASLRFGELAALQRQHLDATAGWVQVRATVVELIDGSLIVGPPKTAAGRRTVAIPSSLLGDVRSHLDEFVAGGPDALVFTGPRGAPLRRSNFQSWWRPAMESADISGVRFHDLRHTGNTITAQSGATLSDLMARMGHASTRAAQIYLHTTSTRDRTVADAMNDVIRAARAGTERARGYPRRTLDSVTPSSEPVFAGLGVGAGDENRTRTVSLGS